MEEESQYAEERSRKEKPYLSEENRPNKSLIRFCRFGLGQALDDKGEQPLEDVGAESHAVNKVDETRRGDDRRQSSRQHRHEFLLNRLEHAPDVVRPHRPLRLDPLPQTRHLPRYVGDRGGLDRRADLPHQLLLHLVREETDGRTGPHIVEIVDDEGRGGLGESRVGHVGGVGEAEDARCSREAEHRGDSVFDFELELAHCEEGGASPDFEGGREVELARGEFESARVDVAEDESG